MRYSKKTQLPKWSGLWLQHFSTFQSAEGLPLRDFVCINNISDPYLCVTQRNSVRVILCFSERRLEELEGKHSDLRRELVSVKEALSQVSLQKEVLEDDKASLALALSKVPCPVSSQPATGSPRQFRSL